jgi:putative SOS response-associated peptidase YedK
MCGRYASFLPAEALARIFGTVNPLPNLEQTWNMAPTRDAPVVRLSRDGQRHLDALRWGLIPYFAKDLNAVAKGLSVGVMMRSVPLRQALEHFGRPCFVARQRLVLAHQPPGQE